MPKSAKFLIGFLIIACIAPMFIKGPDGRPLMTVDDWIPDIPESTDDLIPGSTQLADDLMPSEPTTVYKWQDENGQWHFSSTPPNETASEEMELDGDINIMDAYEEPEPERVARAEPAFEMPSSPMTASPEQIQEMMDTVNNLQDTIDQRKADMDEIAQPALGGNKN